VMAISAAAVFAVGLWLLLLRKDSPADGVASDARAPASSATASATPSAPAPAVTDAPAAPKSAEKLAGVESATPSAPAPAAQESGETEAREALLRLRAGIQACVRDIIGFLPGTSPAVPANLATLKAGPYASPPRDWSTPVWSCSKFRQAAPQRFQLQWQMTKPGAEGIAVAWLDDNADGKADRAFGFRATLKEKGHPEMGEVEAIDASHPVLPPPR
jgi:hypothetical protein